MKLLITTMSLDIGGAETHVTELALALHRRGIDVSVASNGGAYVKKLTENGVRHIVAPLHSKNPAMVLRALKILRRDIENEGYDIVHAHARIPCFVCGILAKELPFRLVSTCHGVFQMNFLWKHCANWGERSLAVSCDIKDYLIKNYSLPSSQIALTINGINSDEYKKYEGERKSVCERYGLDKNCFRRIVYVSRIDIEVCCVGFMLIDAMDGINARFGDCELVIIGGGSSFEDMKAKAEAKNAQLGRRAIIMTGSSTEIPRLLQCGDIFVGVSRAALEGMATGLPVILAGAQGYLGIFEERSLSGALQTNFTARGYDLPDGEKLKKDVIELFSKSDDERRAMSEYNKKIVLDFYPVDKMASDAKRMYDSLYPYKKEKYSDVVISGYYGYGNTGDDSLLSAIISRLREEDPSLSITVLSAKPKETAKMHNVNSIARFDFPRIASALKRAKLFINGSGNLLQNVTSSRSLLYYITLIKLAKKSGCRIMIYAGGLGPIKGSWAEKVTRHALDRCDVITLREKLSMQVMEKIKADVGKVSITADPAMLVKSEDDAWVNYLFNKYGIGEDFFVVSVRDWKDRENIIESCVNCVKRIEEKYGFRAVYIVMQTSVDRDITEKCAALTDSTVIGSLNAAELCGVLRRAKFMIGMRLHTLVYSAAVGTPFVGISYDDKVRGMVDRYSDDLLIDWQKLSADELTSRIDRIMNDYDDTVKMISKVSAQQKKLALYDGEIAYGLINGK